MIDVGGGLSVEEDGGIVLLTSRLFAWDTKIHTYIHARIRLIHITEVIFCCFTLFLEGRKDVFVK
jgi:hypothetical protein